MGVTLTLETFLPVINLDIDLYYFRCYKLSWRTVGRIKSLPKISQNFRWQQIAHTTCDVIRISLIIQDAVEIFQEQDMKQHVIDYFERSREQKFCCHCS
jgi:hypothetical protein